MSIEIIQLGEDIMRVLVVDKNTPSQPCENCGQPCYSHELLAKEDPDWCMNCNDEEHRKGWSDRDIGIWCIEQMAKGLAVAVVTREEKHLYK